MAKLLKQFKDNELVNKYQKFNDEAAILTLYHRYLPYIYKAIGDILSMNSGCGISFEELKSVALSTIYVSARTISKMHKSFFSYYRLALQRDLVDYIRKNSYLIGAKGFSGLSLSSSNNENDGLTFAETLGFNDDSVNAEVEIHKLVNDEKLFTKRERVILNLYLDGVPFPKIAKMTHQSLSNTYHQFSKLTKTLRDIISERYFK